MRVVLSKDAVADLDEIANWIALDNLERAERFVETLRRRCAALSRHPRRHPVVHRTEAYEIRKIAYRRYLIFYRTLESRVEVLRIVHGARDWVADVDLLA